METPARLPDPRQVSRARPGATGPDEEEERRAVKLRLPVDQVMKLHTLRILQSAPIGHFVEAALEAYFARQRALRASASEEQ